MAAPSRIYDLSATASSNTPSGTEAVGTGLDDYLRGIQAVIRGDLATKGADIASASTTDLGAVQGLSHDITGTTTITSFGTVAAGVWKIVKFEGALTLTHNATSLILPGGANITTANGDIGTFISEGSGNWRCVSYFKADGTALVASSAAPFIDSTAIIKGSADATKLVRIEADGITTGTTRVWTAPDEDVNLVGANFVQEVATVNTDLQSNTTAIAADGTIPQNSEGSEVFTIAITPKNTSHILHIEVGVWWSNSGANTNIVALFQDTTADALAAVSQYIAAASATASTKMFYRMAAGTTSATTFKVRVGATGGTWSVNGAGGSSLFGGVGNSYIKVTEMIR